MDYDYRAKKIVAVVSEKLEPGQAANVVGHLAVSFGAATPGVLGRPVLADASGGSHAGIAKYPFVILRANAAKIARVVTQAKAAEGLAVHDYPRQMLDTGHDDELSAALSAAPADTLEYLGVLIYGDAARIAAITGKFSLYR